MSKSTVPARGLREGDVITRSPLHPDTECCDAVVALGRMYGRVIVDTFDDLGREGRAPLKPGAMVEVSR